METVFFAFMLTLLAGLSTGIGGLIALLPTKQSPKFLSVSLGFSAGVMIYVSMIEIFGEARDILTLLHGARSGMIYTVVAFFAGMLFIGLIDRLVPKEANPHEIVSPEQGGRSGGALMRTGLMTALAIGVHNFPEGMATFISALQEPEIAIPIAVAIGIHNIPEGIAVAIPIQYATGNRKKAFGLALVSGLAEPLGALAGYLILRPFLSDTLLGVVFAAVAGIMVFISLDELLPTAREYGEHHLSIYGLVAGMAVMAVSLILFL